MASSKDAKSRRQAQNRAQREALAARREAAKAKADPRVVGSSSQTGSKSRWQKLLGPPAAAASGGGATGSATRSGRPVRPGSAFLRRFGYEEPGGRAVHFAAVLTIAASIMALLYPVVGLNSQGVVPKSKPSAKDLAGLTADAYHKVTHHVTLLSYEGGKAILLIGAPVVVALITVLLSRPGTRKRTWGIGALALFIWVVLGGIGYFYFVPAAAMGFGWWQAGKEEREARMAQQQKAREARRRGGTGGRPAARSASPAGGLFKRRDVVDTTAAEVTGASEEIADEQAEETAADLGTDTPERGASDGGDPAGGRDRRPKPSKADVAAAIAAGRRGQRRSPQR